MMQGKDFYKRYQQKLHSFSIFVDTHFSILLGDKQPSSLSALIRPPSRGCVLFIESAQHIVFENRLVP
jgi:hypothetical protein